MMTIEQCSYCNHLKEFITVQTGIIEKHIDKHKWFNHIEDKNEAICDFVDRYGWLIREFYCRYMCENKNNCSLINNINK